MEIKDNKEIIMKEMGELMEKIMINMININIIINHNKEIDGLKVEIKDIKLIIKEKKIEVIILIIIIMLMLIVKNKKILLIIFLRIKIKIKIKVFNYIKLILL